MPTLSAAIAIAIAKEEEEEEEEEDEEEEEEEEEELLVLARFTFLPPRDSVDEGAAATSPIPPPFPLRVSNGYESANIISRVAL